MQILNIFPGIWSKKEDILKLRKIDKTFIPNKNIKVAYKNNIIEWKKAVEKFKDWY